MFFERSDCYRMEDDVVIVETRREKIVKIERELKELLQKLQDIGRYCVVARGCVCVNKSPITYSFKFILVLFRSFSIHLLSVDAMPLDAVLSILIIYSH